MRKRYLALTIGIIGLAGVWAWNSSILAGPSPDAQIQLIAHRGVHQTFFYEGIDNQTCTAERTTPIVHDFMENTPQSVNKAMDAGADIVEIDIAMTKDEQLAVFHDWTLECRTNAEGPIRDKTMAELKALDIGYGYTDDEGKTFPFRGKFEGAMPELSELVAKLSDPNARLLINFKSNDQAEGELLLKYLDKNVRLAQMTNAVYGGQVPVEIVTNQRRKIIGYSAKQTKSCLIEYFALGWSGHVPEPCRNAWISVPANFAPLLWGWPHRMSKRFAEHGSRLILMGPMDPRETGSRGIDREEELHYIPENFDGFIWTNRIEAIGPILNE